MLLHETRTQVRATGSLDHLIPELLVQWSIWGRVELALGSHRAGSGKTRQPVEVCPPCLHHLTVFALIMLSFKIITTYYLV